MDLGETIGQTAVREVREETGLDVKIDGIVGVYSDPRHIIEYSDGEVRQQSTSASLRDCSAARYARATSQQRLHGSLPNLWKAADPRHDEVTPAALPRTSRRPYVG